jgi:hypothetical protein
MRIRLWDSGNAPNSQAIQEPNSEPAAGYRGWIGDCSVFESSPMITRRRVSSRSSHWASRSLQRSSRSDEIDLTWPSARLARLPDDYLVAGGFFDKFYRLSVNVARLAFSEAKGQKSLAETRGSHTSMNGENIPPVLLKK